MQCAFLPPPYTPEDLEGFRRFLLSAGFSPPEPHRQSIYVPSCPSFSSHAYLPIHCRYSPCALLSARQKGPNLSIPAITSPSSVCRESHLLTSPSTPLTGAGANLACPKGAPLCRYLIAKPSSKLCLQRLNPLSQIFNRSMPG